jgi:hypothetical protein
MLRLLFYIEYGGSIFSETSAKFYQTTWRQIPEDRECLFPPAALEEASPSLTIVHTETLAREHRVYKSRLERSIYFHLLIEKNVKQNC